MNDQVKFGRPPKIAPTMQKRGREKERKRILFSFKRRPRREEREREKKREEDIEKRMEKKKERKGKRNSEEGEREKETTRKRNNYPLNTGTFFTSKWTVSQDNLFDFYFFPCEYHKQLALSAIALSLVGTRTLFDFVERLS